MLPVGLYHLTAFASLVLAAAIGDRTLRVANTDPVYNANIKENGQHMSDTPVARQVLNMQPEQQSITALRMSGPRSAA